MTDETMITHLPENASLPSEEASDTAKEAEAIEHTATAAEETDEPGGTIERDIQELKEEFPELSELESITELTNPIRYAALRDLGLSPAEAYILTSRRKTVYDNRSHLTPSVPAKAKSPTAGMSAREFEQARQIFSDISDSEIYKLYKKVTK